jgi:hypothetical protein
LRTGTEEELGPAATAPTIFVGLLIERMIHTAEAISPWGYTLAAPPQPMARN